MQKRGETRTVSGRMREDGVDRTNKTGGEVGENPAGKYSQWNFLAVIKTHS